ncbi:transcription termination factor 2-like [Liolophura sinensis]|uniref:transcription termination factor 2-like n=1 Tax=Liolophura sinensis TaxID=3198878 RepID=UPI003158035C
MESVSCSRHGAPCMLKTGSKSGPNYGKSFYICSVLRDKCDFVKSAPNVPSSYCLKHPDNIADLQYIAEGKVSGEKRHYYRCRERVESGSNWCGYSVIGTIPRIDPLRDSQLHNVDESVIITSVSVKKAVSDAEGKLSAASQKTAARDRCSLNGSRIQEHGSKITTGSRQTGVSNTGMPDNGANSTIVAGSHASSSSEVINLDETSFGLADTPPMIMANSTLIEEDNAVNTEVNAPPKSLTSSIHIDLTKTAPVTSLSSKLHQSNGHTATHSSKQQTSGTSEHGGSGDRHRSQLTMEINQSMKEKLTRELKQKKQMLGTVNLNTLPDKGRRLHDQVEDLQRQLSYLNLQLVNNPHLAKEAASVASAKSSVPPNVPPAPPVPAASKPVPLKISTASHVRPLDPKDHRASSAPIVRPIDPKSTSSASSVRPLAPKAPPAPQVYTVYPSQPSGSTGQTKTIHVLHQPKGASGDSGSKQIVQGTKQTVLSFKTMSSASGQKQTIALEKPEPIPDHVLQQMYGANPQMKTLYGGRMTADRLKEVGSVTKDAIEGLHKQLERRPAETAEVEDPRGLKVNLMIHQRQALAWLIWREHQTPAGGILADDMGLGKTLTMISLVMKQRELKGPEQEATASGRKSGDWMSKDKQLHKVDKNIIKSRATLVICPASLIHQWQKEIENRVTPGILEKVLLYHGPNREPNVLKLADNDIVLTTYNIVSKEVASDASAKDAEKPVEDQDFLKGKKGKNMPNLLKIAWERVILDEAHNIKNHKCKTAIGVCRLRAWCRWALTGTPIQNDLIDMYSLLRFLRCSPFDEFQVWKRQVATNAGTGKVRLNTLVKTFLLRREKNQKGPGGKPLVPLPTKTIIVHELRLSKEEKSVYDKVYAQSQSKFKDYLKRHAEKNGGDQYLNDTAPASLGGRNPFMDKPGASTGPVLGQKGTGGTHILVSLLRLRQCCGHLSLLKEAIEDDVLETEGIELTLEEQMRGLMLGDSEKPGKKSAKSEKSLDQFDIAKVSTKVKAVMNGLMEVQKKSTKSDPIKSVVVSQWTRMLEIVAHHLLKAGIRCSVIQGNIPPHKRMETVEDFNTNPTGPTVLLLSLRAGGVGLNLIGGSNLFLLDQHWNPALEEQAFDRVYRVGQTKDVVIHKFLCAETVEEKIAELQKWKTELANDILTGTGGTKRKLTLADLRLLFGV